MLIRTRRVCSLYCTHTECALIKWHSIDGQEQLYSSLARAPPTKPIMNGRSGCCCCCWSEQLSPATLLSSHSHDCQICQLVSIVRSLTLHSPAHTEIALTVNMSNQLKMFIWTPGPERWVVMRWHPASQQPTTTTTGQCNEAISNGDLYQPGGFSNLVAAISVNSRRQMCSSAWQLNGSWRIHYISYEPPLVW